MIQMNSFTTQTHGHGKQIYRYQREKGERDELGCLD